MNSHNFRGFLLQPVLHLLPCHLRNSNDAIYIISDTKINIYSPLENILQHAKRNQFRIRKLISFYYNMQNQTKKPRRWSIKYKRSINCRKPRGFSQKQYCKYGRKRTSRTIKTK